jgi:hypothetical protein
LKNVDAESEVDLSLPRVDLEGYRKLAKSISLGLQIPARETRYKVIFITAPDEWEMNLRDFVRIGKLKLFDVDENDPPENIRVDANNEGALQADSGSIATDSGATQANSGGGEE